MFYENRTAGPQPYASFLNSSLHDAAPNLGWNYPVELQHMVHQHWRGFAAPQIYHSAFFFIGFFALMISSIFGNGLVIWIFSTSKNLRTPSNLLIINLAIFDLIMCTNIPMYLLNTVHGYFLGGDMACDVYALAGGVSGQGSAMTNAFIAFDRYRTISNPIDGRLNFAQIALIILFTWLWIMPFSILPFFNIWGRYVPEGFLTTCSFDYLTDDEETRFFTHTFFVWAYCFPMLLICTFYFKLFLHVRDHEKMLAEQAKKMNVKSLSANAKDDMSVEMRIAKAAMVIWMMFIVSWTPYSVVALVSSFGHQYLVTPFLSMLPCMSAKFVSCVDPWVYAASHPKYRLELERRLPWLGIREKQAASTCGTSIAASETGTVSMEQ